MKPFVIQWKSSELNNQDIFCSVENYEYLQGLSLVDNTHHENKKIDLLIGMDYYYSCVSGAQIKGQPNEPIDLSSIFGWIICGFYENSKSAFFNICDLLPTHCVKSVQIRSFF